MCELYATLIERNGSFGQSHDSIVLFHIRDIA
jgi:hypothetical protein